MAINLKFRNKPNESLKPGDIAFFTSTSNSVVPFTQNAGIAKRLGVVRSIKHVSEVLSTEVSSANNLLSQSALTSVPIVNGEFDNDLNGWSDTNSGVGWTWDATQKVKYESGTQYSKFWQKLSTEIGSVYKVTVTVSDISGGATVNFGFSQSNTSTFHAQSTVDSNITAHMYILANATDHRVQIQNNQQAGSFLVDNILVSKLSTPDYWIVNVDIPNTVADPSVDDYVYFTKDTSVNFNGVTGYFAETTLSNSKTSQAELYAVNFEVIESSK